MTNEELGRAWAERHGKRPIPRHLSGGCKLPSWDAMGLGTAEELPAEVLESVRQCDLHFAETPGGLGSRLSYDSEEEAYHALGLAIRKAFAGTVVGESLGLNEKPVVTT